MNTKEILTTDQINNLKLLKGRIGEIVSRIIDGIDLKHDKLKNLKDACRHLSDI